MRQRERESNYYCGEQSQCWPPPVWPVQPAATAVPARPPWQSHFLSVTQGPVRRGSGEPVSPPPPPPPPPVQQLNLIPT